MRRLPHLVSAVRPRRPKPLLWLGALLLLCRADPLADTLRAQNGGEDRDNGNAARTREQMRVLPPPSHPGARPAPAPTPYNPWRARQPYQAPTGAPGAPEPAPTPAPSPRPSNPAPSASGGRAGGGSGGEDSAPVVIIEKSGQSGDAEEAAEPVEEPPPPPPKKRGFWARLFGGGGEEEDNTASYRFLTRRVLDEINRAPVRKGRWKYTVVHNSGTRQGSARAFDFYHRHTRHMPNGMAYHFVIGNGTTTGDGQVEIGDRWRRQINGGHVHSDYLNNIAVGICLVGDFNRDQPTKAQYAALQELITYLRKRVGRIDRRLSIVKAHREINPVPTDCPGSRFSYSWLHRTFD